MNSIYVYPLCFRNEGNYSIGNPAQFSYSDYNTASSLYPDLSALQCYADAESEAQPIEEKVDNYVSEQLSRVTEEIDNIHETKLPNRVTIDCSDILLAVCLLIVDIFCFLFLYDLAMS